MCHSLLQSSHPIVAPTSSSLLSVAGLVTLACCIIAALALGFLFQRKNKKQHTSEENSSKSGEEGGRGVMDQVKKDASSDGNGTLFPTAIKTSVSSFTNHIEPPPGSARCTHALPPLPSYPSPDLTEGTSARSSASSTSCSTASSSFSSAPTAVDKLGIPNPKLLAAAQVSRLFGPCHFAILWRCQK